MTIEEAKQALSNGEPVALLDNHIQDGPLKYKRISALIYRRGQDGKYNVTAELEDCGSRSVTIANLDRIYKTVHQK